MAFNHSISKKTARRFVLGRQGLWPGRRWTGLDGTAQALQAVEAVQMDPLVVVARSHHIVLWSRVLDYQPEFLDQLLYQERQFFDYGESIFIYPMSELPYWRTHMQRLHRTPRWAKFAAENQALMEEVRAELHERGPLGNRDLDGHQRVRSYRGRKDSALALYQLWRTGEVMIHHRRGFDRVYDFRDKIAPPEWNCAATEGEAEAYFACKAVALRGLIKEVEWKNSFSYFIQDRLNNPEARQRMDSLLQQGVIAEISLEESKDAWYVLADDLPLLETLEAGGVPAAWEACYTTTTEEVTILAPLDIVSTRGRAARLFDFDYVWEVYKPAATRRWGYYTIPILYGDRLVARLDPKLERSTQTLLVKGFWLEDPASAGDAQFCTALARGLLRFGDFLKAQRINIAGIQPAHLQEAIKDALSPALEVQLAPID